VPLTTPAATNNQAGMSAIAPIHIEAVNDIELAPYVPHLIHEGENYYTNIWSLLYCPHSFDI